MSLLFPNNSTSLKDFIFGEIFRVVFDLETPMND